MSLDPRSVRLVGVLSLMSVDLITLEKLYVTGLQEEVQALITDEEYRQPYFLHQLELLFSKTIDRGSYPNLDWSRAYRLASEGLLHAAGGDYLKLALDVGLVEWTLQLAGAHGLPAEVLPKMFDLTKLDVMDELQKAASNGHANVLKFILENVGHMRDIVGTPLIIACSYGHLEAAKVLLSYKPDIDSLGRSFGAACQCQYPEVISLLLENPLTPVNNVGLGIACAQGCFEVVKLILPRCDPSMYGSGALKLACAKHLANPKGRAQVVKLLLEDGRVDPTIEDGVCMRQTMNGKDIEIFTLLLKDGRCSPNFDKNECLRWACQRSYLEIISLLLNDPSVDPAHKHSQCLTCADGPRQLEVIRLLLEDGRVNFKHCSLPNFRSDCVELIKMLLLFYPNFFESLGKPYVNSLLVWSLEHRDVEAVKLLLQVPLVRSSLTADLQMRCYNLLHN